MSEDATNSVDLKKRARRRLVGAAALALLAVIVLPVVMDSNPKPVGQDIQIRIPSQDSETVTANVLPGNATLPSAVPATRETPDNHQADAPTVKPPIAKAVDPAGESKTAETESSITKPAEVRKPEPAKEVSAPKSEAAHAADVLSGKDPGQWIVQLGAYRNDATVKTMTAKLKAMGLSVYTEKADVPAGATRVRVGPFNSRDSADKALGRVKKIGLDGVVKQKQ